MGSDKIFLVRLESGENIAQYTSQTAQPLVGDIINIRHQGHIKPFEIVEATLQPMIENYQIGVLIVKTPAINAILRAMLHGSQIREMLVGLLIGYILIVFRILKKRRMGNKL
jgi:hypothetical protein